MVSKFVSFCYYYPYMPIGMLGIYRLRVSVFVSVSTRFFVRDIDGTC